VLRDNPVEVVMLQETTREWEPSLRKTLGARYPYAHFVHSSRWTAGGSAIFSRFPLEDVEELPSPIGWFSAMRAVVDAPDGAVELVNVHLRPAVSDSGSWVEGYLTTGPSRQKEMESYFERFDPKLPTIVAGDFNEDDTGHALRMLSREGFANAMTETGSDASTWRWTAYGLPLRLRLDHVAYDDDGFVIEEARVLDGGRSDHLAVVATLRRRH
jgi:endonuclease/exonuclease/phosphatase (EEP) superfamily protein YafD